MSTKRQKAIARGNQLLASVEASIDDVAGLEFPISKFPDAAAVRSWTSNHGFPKAKVVSTRETFGVRVRDDLDFEDGSLRREKVGRSGVVVSVGTLKSHLVTKQVPSADASTEDKREAQRRRAEEFGIEVLEGEGERLSFPSDGPTKLSEYGDPVNLKFFLDTEARAANARVRFKQNADVYERESSKRVIHERIVRAELAFGIEPGFDPDDPLDALLPGDLKERLQELSKQAIRTGTTNGHWHTVELDADGNGTTSSPNTDPDGHTHRVVAGEVRETEDHTHSLEVERRRVEFAKRTKIFVRKAVGDEDPNKVVRMFGIVMKPEIPDSDGVVTSKEEIASANDQFMREFGTVGFMHSKDVSEKVKLIQNVIAPVDLEFPLQDGTTKSISEGTWYQELFSDDEDIVARVRKEQITGLSIGGFAKEVPITQFDGKELLVLLPDSYTPAMKRAIQEVVNKAEGDPALARFVDLRVEEVSLVDAAANEEEFFIIKRRREMPGKDEKKAAGGADQGIESPVNKNDPSIADQVAAGVTAGIKGLIDDGTIQSPPPVETPQTKTDDPEKEDPKETSVTKDTAVLDAIGKVNDRLDGIEATQKAQDVKIDEATRTRAVAKGQAAPEETETASDEPEKPVAKWAGTVVHEVYGPDGRGARR